MDQRDECYLGTGTDARSGNPPGGRPARILIADDDPISRKLLQTSLVRWGHEVLSATDGRQALAQLQAPAAPSLAILDWMMPELDGVEVCRQVRQLQQERPVYLILLTARDSPVDIVTGLDAGADDYMTKPFEQTELRARLNVGLRIIELQQHLAQRVRELEEALARVKQLHGLLPICAWCKNIRNDQNYWERVEDYLAAHSDAQFTHGICPDCLPKAKLSLRTASPAAGMPVQ